LGQIITIMDITKLSQLDLSKSYSYADYLTWKFQERLELIKGKIFKMSPAPRRIHQEISRDLLTEMNFFLKGGKCNVFSAPFDVRLPKSNAEDEIYTVVQPDICVVCDPSKLDDAGCVGAPDLIVEILSESTAKKDKTNKFELYQECGVKEYWIVSPTDQYIELFVLEEGKYAREGVYTKDDEITSQVLTGFSLSLGSLFS